MSRMSNTDKLNLQVLSADFYLLLYVLYGEPRPAGASRTSTVFLQILCDPRLPPQLLFIPNANLYHTKQMMDYSFPQTHSLCSVSPL